jgi:pre-mRNA-splicing factor SYF2
MMMYSSLVCRQYNRLVKSIKPDMERYECQKQKIGEAFYGGQNAILHGLHKDTKEGIDCMVQDLDKQ